MATIQDTLNTFIETTLNTNTKSVTFKTGYLFWLDDGKLVTSSQTNYTITETDYIATMVGDWVNTAYPYPTIDMQDWVLPVTFLIKQTSKDNVLDALDEFRTTLQGTEQTVGSYNVGFKVSQPNPPSDPIAHAGSYWLIVQMVVSASALKGVSHGNGVTIKIKKSTDSTYTTLVHEVADVTIDNQLTPTKTTQYAEHYLENSTQVLSITFFQKDAIGTTLLNELWQGESNKYDIQFVYSDTVTKSGQYKVKNLSQSIQAGTPLSFTITFMKVA